MLQKFKNWAKATKRTSLYKQQFKEIEDALKAAKNPQNAKVGNIKKMPLNCVFHFEEIPNGLPNISYLKNDLYGTKNSNGCLFLNNLNVSSTKKINKLDFSIYNVPQGTKDISLYPEATFNL